MLDESQDFADTWWPAMSAMKYEDSGLYVFSDEGSASSPASAIRPPAWSRWCWSGNLRNTRQISETFTTMAPIRLGRGPTTGPGAVRARAPATTR